MCHEVGWSTFVSATITNGHKYMQAACKQHCTAVVPGRALLVRRSQAGSEGPAC